MKLINNYIKAESELFKHVGFEKEYAVVYPIDTDSMKYYWRIVGDYVMYSENPDDLKDIDVDNIYKEYTSEDDCSLSYTRYYIDRLWLADVYNYGIYAGKKITMLVCKPQMDCIKWFKFFNNKLEIEDKK